MASKKKVSRAEMDVLRYVMDHQPVTVRQVADAMSEQKGLARTTVQTLMERLRKKGHLKRRESEGVNQYSLKVPKKTLLAALVGDFIESSLGGSLSPFVAYLAQRAELTDAQTAELNRLIEQLEREERT